MKQLSRLTALGLTLSTTLLANTTAMLSSGSTDMNRLLSGKPVTEVVVNEGMSSDVKRIDGKGGLLSAFEVEDNALLSVNEFDGSGLMSGDTIVNPFDFTVFDYIYDQSVVQNLDLSPEKDVGFDTTLDVKYASNIQTLEQQLNSTMLSIFDKYVSASAIPTKDPLWLMALCAVEYGSHATNDNLIFTLPVNMDKASQDPNYLLTYDWTEVRDSFGLSSVLARDGSSIGPLQLTAGFANNVSAVIPEDFGVIGSVSGTRSDAWVTLGDCKDSGTSIIWKPGVNGDRWSPSDMANITYGVYDYTIKASPTCMDAYIGKYEQAIILMWGHNRGTGIINRDSYRERTKALATCVEEMREFLYELQPTRFSRTTAMMAKVKDIANRTTDGDQYPVMGLMSYLIMEARYNGLW